MSSAWFGSRYGAVVIRVLQIRERASWKVVGWRTLLADLLSTVWNLACALVDGVRVKLPRHWVQDPLREVAFVFHSPNEYHFFTPWPLLRYLPQSWVLSVTKHLPPAKLGHYNVYRPDGQFSGSMYGVFVCPEHLYAAGDLPYSVTTDKMIARVKQAIVLASRRGAHTVGLGAYLPSLTHQGRLITDDPELRDVFVTTGLSCTVAVIRRYLYELVELIDIDLRKETVAILGAAGSMGRAVARSLAQDKIWRLLLLDQPPKDAKLSQLGEQCLNLAPDSDIRWSTEALDQGCLKTASVVIVVTSGIGSILRPEHLGPSTVVIDDSKPRNTDAKVLARPLADGRLLIVDVLAEVPGLKIGFHYDLDSARPEVTYTCGAELQVMNIFDLRESFTVGEVQPAKVAELEDLMARAGVSPAPLTSFTRPIREEELLRFAETRRRAFDNIRSN